MHAPSRTVRFVSFVAAFAVSAALTSGVAGLAKAPAAHPLLAQAPATTVVR